MPYLNGVVTAGIAEATRVAQTVIHRGAEVGALVAAGETVDRAHADRIPQAAPGARMARRPRRDRDTPDRRRRRGDDEAGEGRPDDPGGRVDLMA